MRTPSTNQQSPTEDALDPRMALAFPTLSAADLKALEKFGKPKHIAKGDAVWEAGQANMCMFVVLKGKMEIVDGRNHKEHIAFHMPGQFSGDIDVLSGRPSIVAAVAKTDLHLLEIEADCVRKIVGEFPTLGNVILRAFLMRRTLLQEQDRIGLQIFGSRYCPDVLRIREFLSRNRFPFHWEDLEDNPNTKAMLAEFQVVEEQTPVVVLPSGAILNAPSNIELANGLGIARPIEGEFYDLVVIGAGPAGLAAAVYGASEGLKTIVLDESGPGGQAGSSARIENYMGFPGGISGQDLADRAVAQAERFGVNMLVPATVSNVTCNKLGGHIIDLDSGEKLETRCVLVATGARYRKLDVDNFADFEGRGIYYACTNVERILCQDSKVAIVGAGNSAGQAAMYMSESTAHVCLIVRGDDLRKSMSSYLARRIEASEKITVHLNSEICALQGDGHLEAATVRCRESGKTSTEAISGVFVMIGADPCTDWVPDTVARDQNGFVITGPALAQHASWSLSRPPFFLETTCPGVFAAGDVRSNSIKRVASAVGEGSMSVAFVHQYLATT